MKVRSPDYWMDQIITGSMIVIQLVMAILVAVVLMVIGFPFKVSLLLGAIVWTIVLFKTPVFTWCFIYVEPNISIILSNQMIHDSVPEKTPHLREGEVDPRVLLTNARSLREIGSGIRGKLPWEVVAESVDRKSEIVIDEAIQCYAENGPALLVKYQVVLTPLQGFLKNLFRRGQEASIAKFKGDFEQAIISWVKSEKEEAVFKDLKQEKLKETFTRVHGGPNRISKDEEDHGIYTNSPQIIAITRSPSFAAAAEAEEIGKRLQTIVRGLIVELPNADPNMILAAATSIAGKEIPGLLLVPGANEKLREMVIAAKGLGIQPSTQKKTK